MFQSSTPVTHQAFFNRTMELARLRHAVQRLEAGGSPTWLAIIGQRKVGKTSLIRELQRSYRGRAVHFVHMDVNEHMPISALLFRTYALRVLDGVVGPTLGRSAEAAAGSRRYARLLHGSSLRSQLPPDLFDLLLDLPEFDVHSETVSAILDLPEQLAKAFDVRVFVSWDEFQEMLGIAKRLGFDPIARMRSVWQRHERVSYVVSGSAPSVLRHMILDRASPFFQHFDVMELGPMHHDDAMDLLREGSEGVIPTELAARLVELSGGHPFYLQVLGEELLHVPGPADDDALRDALQRTLFSGSGRLGLYFDRVHTQLVGRSTYVAATLSALATFPEGATLTEIAGAIRAPTGDTARYLARVGDVVLHQGRNYSLADPMFGLWLRWRAPRGSVVPMAVLGSEGERRAAEALATMGFDLVYRSRASRGAFDLLATRGGDQLGIQVKRSNLPLRFPLTAWHRMEAEAAKMGWHWVIAAVNDEVAFLDPARARVRKTARVHPEAIIDNVLLWLDQRPTLP